MSTLAVILIMVGGLFIWAGLSDNSIIGLLGGVFGSKSKGKK